MGETRCTIYTGTYTKKNMEVMNCYTKLLKGALDISRLTNKWNLMDIIRLRRVKKSIYITYRVI